MMKNYLNNIYCSVSIPLNSSDSDFYYEKSCNMYKIGFILNYNYHYETIVKIFDEFYGGRLEVFHHIKKFIDDNSFMDGQSFYVPMRSLTEDERFYIILKYGEIGSLIINEHTE